MDNKDFKRTFQYFIRNIFNFKGELPFHLYKKLMTIPQICAFIILVLFLIYLFKDIFSGYQYSDLSLKEAERLEALDQFKRFSFIICFFLLLYLTTLSSEIKRFRFLGKSPVVYLALGFIGLPLIYAYSYYSNVIMHSTSTVGILLIILIPLFANSKNKPTDRDKLYEDYDFEDV
ncbi:hypothetical protein KFV08_10370 [Macrococcoides canis]|uniref:hypothetical protein n=1 Tax=Macrococcoides canis TaxID=1855823 RepID=UPI00207C8027|nr:hypothetical protein [Macrococcus canis]MCO4097685.1 hypothetical protein [Macrococcus canis]UTH08880.1 hypothetical protein KFV08_10370 [Macrococcus canis]